MNSSPQTNGESRGADCILVIMAKAPKSGMVKTRLAESIPVEAVSELYRCLLEDTLAVAQSLCGVEVAVVCPASDVHDLERLFGNEVQVVAQTGLGLAAALTSVFAHFTAGGRRVIAFNSDSPHLPASVLERAFNALATYDVIIGPTHDGGYYLVGAKDAHPGLFNGDGLGTSNALEKLQQRVQALELSSTLADPFYDIDVENDLIRLAEELRVDPARAPRTATWLAQRRRPATKRTSPRGEL